MGAKLAKALSPYGPYEPLAKSSSGVPSCMSDDDSHLCQLEEDEQCKVSPEIQRENLYSLARIASANPRPDSLPVSTASNVPNADQPLRLTHPTQISSDTALVVTEEPERRMVVHSAGERHAQSVEETKRTKS